MKISVLTLFPHMFAGPMGESIIGRAVDNNLLELNLMNIRDYTKNKHKKVDDYPYGGGAGMVMQADPIFNALESIDTKNSRIIYMTPKGKVFNQDLAIEFSKEEHLVFLCGHYEGVDQRVIDHWVTDEVSIGDYVLTGGELPAMVMIDSIARMIPGVLGQKVSYMDESIYSGLLEYPHYTRPSEYRGMLVPEVLLSGNHKKIEQWRMDKSLEITREKRPDLYKKYKKL
ncbi:tRNA (guanosine(37)-N1)-methyltransferase TrmD [Anaeromicrobium sediminis]|uniref:tRNA (guanine-N(1)-)-methyltransferase n=1 Tax=Anaeromicrobium sediminis TaxID=1478221 RepID=A0A267MMM6_9FIRM|nr:tRNA (guanosine(37)-N1)-methyltransferase TrmD [Anaeromicrobium sediminis]PAB60854.1 tRNA (guanosine(37)-N1)-methyltransferase TrmD [Anaeromicrobium sediminis]